MDELADRAGVHRTYVGLLERRARQPTLAVTASLAEALGLSLADPVAEAEHDVGNGYVPEVELVHAPPRRQAERACLVECPSHGHGGTHRSHGREDDRLRLPQARPGQRANARVGLAPDRRAGRAFRPLVAAREPARRRAREGLQRSREAAPRRPGSAWPSAMCWSARTGASPGARTPVATPSPCGRSGSASSAGRATSMRATPGVTAGRPHSSRKRLSSG